MSGLDNEKAVELPLEIELIRMKGFSATSIGIAFFHCHTNVFVAW